MMNNWFKLVITAAGLYLAMIGGCSPGDDLVAGDEGSGTKTGNPQITGIINNDNGKASGAIVTLYPRDFNPVSETIPDSLRAVTDSGGGYTIQVTEPGYYNLHAFVPENNTAVLMDSLEIPDVQDTSIIVHDGLLKKASSVKIHTTELSLEAGEHIYVPGSPFSLVLTSENLSSGVVTLQNVPPATLPSIIYLAPDDEKMELLIEPLTVSSSVVSVLGPYYQWSDTFELIINTTSTGADVTEDITEFPLLVRLDKGSGVFAAARADGADLRLSRGDGVTPLPFEIERWDSDAELAEIWVKMDTVYGHNDVQSIRLYVGQASAESASDGAAVFDTQNDFSGVWHLNEPPTGAPGDIKDRTGNQLHGTSRADMAAGNLQPGVIGDALDFDGSNDCVELPASSNFVSRPNIPLTISAWILPDSIIGLRDSVEHRLISIKGDSLGYSMLALGVTSDSSVGHYNRAVDTTLHWSTAVTVNQAFHVSFTFSQGTINGFINGVLAAEFLNSEILPGGAAPAMLGCHRTGILTFAGIIDEFRLSSTIRSAGWINLSYENQKPGSTVVEFKN